MPMWRGRTDWTPPEHVVELVAAIAAGELDQWSGRFLRAGADDLDVAPRHHARAAPPGSSASALRGRRPDSPPSEPPPARVGGALVGGQERLDAHSSAAVTSTAVPKSSPC